MKLNIITPRSAGSSIEVSKVFFPGVEGSFEILSGHAPIVAALKEGDISWDSGSLHIRSGFVQVENNVVTAVVEE